MAAKLTREVLEGYLECQYKGRLRLAGEEGELSDYRRMTTEDRREVRARGLEYLLSRSPGGLTCGGEVLTAATLRGGALVITDATLADEQMSLRYDGLVKAAGSSLLGDFHYLPVLCCEGPVVRQQQRHLLAAFGQILGTLQGRQPTTGVVIHGPAGTQSKVKLTEKLTRQAADTLAAVKQLQAGGPPPILTLNDHCCVCEFQRRCRAEAVRQDDLSLLRGMGEAEVRQHRSRGIFTVTQLSYTFRLRRKGKRVRGREQPYYPALQALAIREAKTFALARTEVPDRPTRIYLDLEGGPDASSVYLLGALVVRGGEERMHSFWSDDPAGEVGLLDQLLQVVGGEDYTLFHFGSYERRFLKRMRLAAKRKRPVDQLLANAVDVLSLVRSAVYFPVYSNGLKEIGRHLGLTWTDPDASGVQTFVWRKEWERTRDEAIKRRLVVYNGEDCAALRAVTEHVAAIGASLDRGDTGSVERVTPSTRGADFRKWGDTAFVLPEFDYANKCAYFDYQREKVVARKGSRKTTPQPSRRKRAKKPRPGKRIVVRSNRCPWCKGRDVVPSRGPRHSKLSFDLKVSAGGVRRVVTRYVAAEYRCRGCKRYFLPKKYKRQPRFLPALQGWAIYQHVANRTTFETLQGIFKECFGLTIGITDLWRFKGELARRYRATYAGMLKKIVAGNLLHADETGVRFKEGRGYVWVFTDLENVAFMFRPTREADFLLPLLKGFTGVLVSDFYAGYNAIPCPQQKCLVHLIRDLNGDLLANVHDQELGKLAKGFGVLLQGIVETIDGHGLRRRHLEPHKACVERFYREFCEQPYQSGVAEQYRKRFLRFRDKLFTFLEHDGVPWNNNNAEHAVKHFAKYRMISNGRMTAKGLEPYLILLSIYQTCVYKGVSFLKFLLSGERDIDAFVAASRGRRHEAGPLRTKEPVALPPAEEPTPPDRSTSHQGDQMSPVAP